MRPAGRAVTAFLIALIIGATPLPVRTPAAEFPAPPQQGTIGTPATRSHAELATEPVLTPLLLSKRVERRAFDWFTLPSRMESPNPPGEFIRIATTVVVPESVARASVRGRAPPV